MHPDYFKWNHLNQLKLLGLLRLHPVLWDQTLTGYTNKNERFKALESIASQMDTTSDIIKRKIHTLRSQYTKEHRLIQSYPNYKPKWKMFEKVKFLYKNRKKIAKSNINYDDDNSSQSFNCSKEDNGDSFSESSVEVDWNITEENCRITRKANENKNFSTEHYDLHEDKYKKSLLCPKSRLKVQRVRDEFIVFGENIANELRLLRDHKQIQQILKCKILRAIVEANEALHRAGWFR